MHRILQHVNLYKDKKFILMRSILSSILIVLFSAVAFASEPAHEKSAEDEKYDPVPPIMHHISDAHEFHVVGDFSIPLPVILWTDNGLVTFMSSEFHHDNSGHHVVTKNGMNFVKSHEKIYQLNGGAEHAEFDAEHHISNGSQPIDISITKNVFSMLLSVFILCLVFFRAAASYKKGNGVPRGVASFMEPIILFIQNDIAIQNIGEKKYKKYMPYLLTVFFFIWFNNLIGLIPIFPFSANLTGNIAVTLVLATITLLITNFSGNRNYWGHIFWMPGAPIPIKIFLIPIELIGMIAKPFALMIRLFANITAGHIVVLSLVSLTFIFKSLIIGGLVSVPFTLFISVLELLVALLQAYVFTMLSALFIGAAVAESH